MTVEAKEKHPARKYNRNPAHNISWMVKLDCDDP